MRLGIFEILEQADQAPDLQDKVDILRRNQSQPLKDVLQAAFDDRIQFLLPEGKVPYKPNQGIGQEGNLYRESRRLYLFVKGGHPHLKQTQRENLFIQMLENLHPKDFELLTRIKDKKLPYPSITFEVFQAAFPEIQVVHSGVLSGPAEVTKPESVPIPSNIAWNDAPPAAVLFGPEDTEPPEEKPKKKPSQKKKPKATKEKEKTVPHV